MPANADWYRRGELPALLCMLRCMGIAIEIDKEIMQKEEFNRRMDEQKTNATLPNRSARRTVYFVSVGRVPRPNSPGNQPANQQEHKHTIE